MPRQDEQRNLNRRRNQSYGRDYGSDVDRMNTDRNWDIDQGRMNMERGGRDADYYSDREEERRFGMQDRGWGQDDQRTFGYGNTNLSRSEQRGTHFGKGPKGWKRSDERIREEACEALYRDSHIDASEIDLSVESGRVFLRGTVDSREAKRHAEECVENLSGVDDVQNELRVNRGSSATNINRESNKNQSEANQAKLS